MIEEIGVVRRVAYGYASVEIVTPGECERCAAHDACRRSGGIVRAPAIAGIEAGGRVRLHVTGVSLLGATSIVYGLPLLGLFAGLVGGYILARPLEGATAAVAAAAGLVCMLGTGFLVRILDGIFGRRVRYTIENIENEQHVPPRALGGP